MARLTHIDEVERREAFADDEEMRAAQEALKAAEARRAASQPAQQEEPATQPAAKTGSQAQRAPEIQADATVEAQKAVHARNASQEEDFHGLDSGAPMGIGQKSLIVLAVIVAVAAVVYVVNTWIHFI